MAYILPDLEIKLGGFWLNAKPMAELLEELKEGDPLKLPSTLSDLCSYAEQGVYDPDVPLWLVKLIDACQSREVLVYALRLATLYCSEGLIPPGMMDAAHPLIDHDDEQVKVHAIYFLAMCARVGRVRGDVLEKLVSLMESNSLEVALMAVEAIIAYAEGGLMLSNVPSTAIRLLERGDSNLQASALRLLSTYAERNLLAEGFLYFAPLLFNSDDESVRLEAASCLWRYAVRGVTSIDVLMPLLKILRDESFNVQVAAARVLWRYAEMGIGGRWVLDELAKPFVRGAAVYALLVYARRGMVSPLVAEVLPFLLEDEEGNIRSLALQVIEEYEKAEDVLREIKEPTSP